MVEDISKELIVNGQETNFNPKRKKAVHKKNENVGKRSSDGSGVSFGKDSFEVATVTYTDTDSIDSTVDPKDIPTTGDELLKWMKGRMSSSFTTTSAQDVVMGEQQETPPVPILKKSKNYKNQQNKKPIHQQNKKKMKRRSKFGSQEKLNVEDFSDLNVPGHLEDPVMFQWRLKKEEQKTLEKKKNKSEVTFLEPTSNISRKKTSPSDMQKVRKKTRKEAKKEAQRQYEIELEEQRQKEEIYQKALMKWQQDEGEEQLREQRNAVTLNRIRRFEEELLHHIWDLIKESEAKHYRTCEKVPLVTKSDQLTSFVKKWEHDIEDMDIGELGKTCCVNLELLKRLEELVFYTSPGEKEKLDQWKWASEMLRNVQERMLDRAMYNILTDVHKNLRIVNLDHGTFDYKNPSFTLSIWLKLDWPIPLPNPRKPPALNREVHLSEVDLICILPNSIQCDKKALICLHLPYDNLSDTSESFYPPPKPDYLTKDLSKTNYEDKLLKHKYAFECYLRAQYKEKVEKFKEKHPDDKYPTPFVLPEVPLNDIPKVPFQNLEPTPHEYVDLADDIIYDSIRRKMCRDVGQEELNLREYQLVGGLYKVQLVFHPPQPQPLVRFHMTLRAAKPLKKLEEVPFYFKFQPPLPPWIELESQESVSMSSKTFKALRGKRLTAKYSSKMDMKKGGGFNPSELQKHNAQELWEGNVQQEKEKMIFISLGLPEDVIYLEKPNVCLWDESLRVWTSADIYEVDHEYHERRISFRSSRFGIIGLSVRKYSNFPYKRWDIRPNPDDSISIDLVGSKVTISLTIQESEIKIMGFEYRLPEYLVGDEGLDRLKYKSMSLAKLIQTMESSGLDMFPDYDANSYYTATTEKHWGVAYVTYHSMAQTAIRYHFCSSRWNRETGRRSMVLRLREFDPHEDVSILRPFEVVQITPSRCQVLMCTEGDDIFSDESTGVHKFQPNLEYLLKSISKVTNRTKIKEFSPITVHTLAKFLIHTRIFSFS